MKTDKKNFTILIIDDEESQRTLLQDFLKKQGYSTITAENGKTGIAKFKENSVNLILTDYKMPDITGEDVVTEIKKINPLTPIILITAFGTIENAVRLMQLGVINYITKPLELSKLIEQIQEIENTLIIAEENENIRYNNQTLSNNAIISNSKQMEEILNIVARVAKSKASILVTGESGTGKELIAQAIHYNSDRVSKPFVVVNCAALPETLFESELFGAEKGAYTGANATRIGKFEEANTGTIFIDEVGDIPLAVQVKLLRALQFGEIQRLGSNKTIKIDTRIISATNKDLLQMISEGKFREDLYYRLNVINLNLPPLRERKIDLPLLIKHFIDKFSEINGKSITNITSEALDLLMKYDFPGNIRELENIIQRSVVLTRDNYIKKEELPPQIVNAKNQDIATTNLLEVTVGDLNLMVENLEKNMIYKALEETNNNQTKAAELLNISERTLRYKLSKYGKN